jgi:hypothetical protein
MDIVRRHTALQRQSQPGQIAVVIDGWNACTGFQYEPHRRPHNRRRSESQQLDITVIDQYDFYYLDRTRRRPLPVMRVLMNEEENTRYYIDPKSARIVSTYSNRNWVNRWLDSALHFLSFPFLYNHRPLWDIVVISFMVGGTALCVTSLVLAWRVLGRKLKRVKAASDVLTAET